MENTQYDETLERTIMFENMHKNKKYAFLDGLLTGIISAYLGKMIWSSYQEDRALRKQRPTSSI